MKKFILALSLNIALTIVAFLQIALFVFVASAVQNDTIKYLLFFVNLSLLLVFGWIWWWADTSYVRTPNYDTYKNGLKKLLSKDTFIAAIILGGLEAAALSIYYLNF